MIVNKGRGYVYGIEYHVVFCTKYRKKILVNDVKENLIRFLLMIADDINIKIIEINADLDHVHLLISTTPQAYVPTIIKRLKGTSAWSLFKLYPELRNELWKGHLWNPSYFISTVSDNLEENIRSYIQRQGR